LTIFSKIKDILTRDLSLTNPKSWNPGLWNLIGSQSLSGENVTEATALTYSAVYNAVTLISGTIGSLPLHLMQRKGKMKAIVDDRKLYRLMHDTPNPYMTAMAFRECLSSHILLWGNCYSEIVRNGMGEIIELWPITPNRVRLAMEGEPAKLVYKIKVDSLEVTIPRDRILHVPGLGFDGFQGYSVISMARKSIGLGMAMETFGATFFGQGTNPGVIVSHPGKLSAQGHDNLQSSLIAGHSGLGKSHKLLLMEEGMKLEKYGIPPNDCQFLESRQFQIPEIARWFNLPPHKLKDLTRSSFSNIEQEQISFVQDSILPWLVRFEQNYNMQLLTDSDRSLSGFGRLYFKHIVEGLLRGDSAQRSAFYGVMLDKGVMSINEVREKEDMDPVPGGDVHLVQMNMQNLKDAGKPPEPLPKPKVIVDPALIPKKGNGKDVEEQDGEQA
jgi:HK97 family phage portal protein